VNLSAREAVDADASLLEPSLALGVGAALFLRLVPFVAVQLDHMGLAVGQQGMQRLRICRLAERGRAGHVAEQDGDGLPLLAGRRDRSQIGAAVGAKGEASFALAPTAGANRHLPRLTLQSRRPHR
jgi:hypothetical protein